MEGIIVMMGCAAIGVVAFILGVRVGRAVTNQQWIQTVVHHGIERAMAAHGYELEANDTDVDATPDAVLETVQSAQLSLPVFDDDETEA